MRVRLIVKNPKIDTYLPRYNANACGLLVSIFMCCTIDAMTVAQMIGEGGYVVAIDSSAVSQD
jgi:hypothetical protein